MAESLGKLPPSNKDAEHDIISVLMQHIEEIDNVEIIITEDDFYFQEYGIIYGALIELRHRDEEVSISAVQEILKKKNAPMDILDKNYLYDLYSSVLISIDVKSQAEIIREKSMLRTIIKQSREIELLCDEGKLEIDDIIKRAEDNIANIQTRHGLTNARPIADVVMDAMESIQRAYENKGQLLGIPTGFEDLDKITAGLHGSELVLIAARPAMGKTAFALTIASHVAFRQNLPVALFSLEMSEVSLVKRLLSMESGVASSRIRDGSFEDMEWEPLSESAERIAASNLIIDEANGITINEIRNRCREYYKQKGIKLVIIDYLQLINGGGGNIGRQQEVSDISRGLKSLARELDIPVIALSQLNRESEKREDKRPMLSDLRDSGAIEQDADVVLLLYREGYYDKDSPNKNKSQVNIAKHRNGETGIIELAWIEKYAKFGNLANAWNRIDRD